jgi:S-(hydroxymethyl)glutathione dehydrogenase / alcohol dehydrogenase
VKAAVLTGPNTLVIEELELDEPAPREMVVRVAAVGLCHSDYHFVTGDMPMTFPAVLGHEPSGIVERVGSMVTAFKPGDRVVGCLTMFCGDCKYCISGRQHLCRDTGIRTRPEGFGPRLRRADGTPIFQGMQLGAFAEKMLIHENSAVKIPDAMPLDLACVLGCSVTTGVGASLVSANVRPGDNVVVIGCGGVGLSAIAGAALAGGRVIAVDRLDSKLDLAKRFGATETINASIEDAVEAVRALTDGGAEHAIEAIGLPATSTQAVAMLGRGGVATIVGVMPMAANFPIDLSLVLDEKRVQGSLLGGENFRVSIPRNADFYLSGRLPLEELVSDRISLDQIADGFAAMNKGEVARQIITFDGVE